MCFEKSEIHKCENFKYSLILSKIFNLKRMNKDELKDLCNNKKIASTISLESKLSFISKLLL